MSSLRQSPEAIVIRRQAVAAARTRRRATFGQIDDREARAAVRAALQTYAARHGLPAAGALASALAGACFSQGRSPAGVRAAAAALFKTPHEGLDAAQEDEV